MHSKCEPIKGQTVLCVFFDVKIVPYIGFISIPTQTFVMLSFIESPLGRDWITVDLEAAKGYPTIEPPHPIARDNFI